MKTLQLRIEVERSARIKTYIQLLSRELKERGDVTVEVTQSKVADLVLDLSEGIGTEGFSITGEPEGAIRITGNDELGLLYGIGKVLHDANYDEGGFTPGRWRGTSIPEGTVRGIYIAFHSNWYSKAPEEEVRRYVDELALWGLNSLVFHLLPWHSADRAEGRAEAERYHRLLKYSRDLGIKVGLLAEVNVAFTPFPSELIAPKYPDTNPVRRGYSSNQVCISKPAGFEFMSFQLDRYLDSCMDIGLDFVVAFPYDAGGCGCDECWPWGARGYLKISKEFSRLAKAKYPDSQFVLCTWCYDVREESDGEYKGLEQALAEDKSWVDVNMADAHEGFPEYALRPGAFAGLPIINFAEISMWGRFPWGGCGANPYPMRLQRLWDQAGHVLSGGFPYSEGNFEDINKIICLRFFWDSSITAESTVRDYVAYEFGSHVVEPVTEAILLLEKTLQEFGREQADVERAYQLMTEADTKVSPRVRASWRWQILYWRAVIDFEKATYNPEITDRCDAAYERLIEVLHLQNGWRAVTPPSRAYLARVGSESVPMEEVLPGAAPERDADTLSKA